MCSHLNLGDPLWRRLVGDSEHLKEFWTWTFDKKPHIFRVEEGYVMQRGLNPLDVYTAFP